METLKFEVGRVTGYWKQSEKGGGMVQFEVLAEA